MGKGREEPGLCMRTSYVTRVFMCAFAVGLLRPPLKVERKKDGGGVGGVVFILHRPLSLTSWHTSTQCFFAEAILCVCGDARYACLYCKLVRNSM